jgi:hypothetical protein
MLETIVPLPRLCLVAGVFLTASTMTCSRSNAAFIMTFTQVGDDVVGVGSGSIDTADLAYYGGNLESALIYPQYGTAFFGPTLSSAVEAEFYHAASGPAAFGSGPGGAASSGSGDLVGVVGSNPSFALPYGYVSGSLLSDTATWDNATFSSLGLTPGTYTLTFGTGSDADSITVNIVAGTPAPEPASLALLATGALGMIGIQRRTMRGRRLAVRASR